jgi:polyhydroxyalkanoate synthesis regulator phasin
MDSNPKAAEDQAFVAERRHVLQMFDSLWSQALVAVSAAEDEAAKVVSLLSQLVGWSPDERRRQLREVEEKLSVQRALVERRVEEALSLAVQKLQIPRREDVQALHTRLEEMQRRVESLTKAGAETP